MDDDQRSDAEARLAAPKLFGRKKPARTPAPTTEREPAAEPAPVAEPTPVAEPAPADEPAAAAEPVVPEQTRPLVAVPAEQAPVEAPDPVEPAEQPEPAAAPRPPRLRLQKAPREPEEPTATTPRSRPLRLPQLTGLQVTGIAGVVVGLFLVLATYGSLHLCASVRGAQTCGGRAGFPLLLAIGTVAVVGGAALLRLSTVRSPMGDSFLAVALVAVVTVLFLDHHYDAWWMLIAVPVISLVAYLLAHWVSEKYIDPADASADRVE